MLVYNVREREVYNTSIVVIDKRTSDRQLLDLIRGIVVRLNRNANAPSVSISDYLVGAASDISSIV